jgi:DUF4097 and DUF4098 domain-containing protein YvlB
VTDDDPGNGARLRLSVANRSGRVRIEARSGEGFSARGGDLVAEADGTMRVSGGHGGSSSVEVVCPAGTDVIVGTASGSVELVGPLGDVRVTTASGRITIEQARRVDLRTASGTIEIGECTGECRVVTKSSKVAVGNAGSLDCSAMSGRVVVGDVEDAIVRTMSGRVKLGTRGSGRVEVRTLSGKVDVAVPQERRPATSLRSLSGRVRCDCDRGSDGEISVATTSGAINVTCR